ncbi:hypothetical protein [Ferruginibacter sp.]
MKRYRVFLLLAAGLFTQTVFAQPHGSNAKKQLEEALTLKGGRVSLESDKELLEPNESAALNIMLIVPPTINEQSGEANGDAYTINLPTGSDPNLPAIYKTKNWKIVEGGGSLVRIDDNSYTYKGPATRPANGVMTISVELYPVGNTLPKVILLKTLYFADNETAIVVNMPAAGINSRKYINKMNTGMKLPATATQGMAPRAASRMPADIQAKLAAAQQQVNAAQQNTGLNLSAITSNAMELYDVKDNFTTVKFTALSMEMYNGKPYKQEAGNVMYTFQFSGKGVGNHPLLKNEKSGMSIIIAPTKVCFCGSNAPSADDKVLCDGSVTILSMDDNYMTGYITSKIYTAVGKTIYQGFIHGKFKVRVTSMDQH